MELNARFELFFSKYSSTSLTQENLPFFYRRDKISIAPNPQIFWTIDPDEDVPIIPTWKEFFLRCNEGVTKTTLWLEKIHSDDRENAVQIFCVAIVKKIPFTAEFRLQKKDKSYLKLLIQGTPVLEDNGRILYWMGTSSKLS